MRRSESPFRVGLLLSLLSLSLVLSGCSGEDGPSGEERAQDYLTEVALWKNRTLEPLLEQVDNATFSDLVIPGRRESQIESAAQQVRCAALDETDRALFGLSAPTLIGKATEQAEDLSRELGEQVSAWREAVLPALNELVTYCTSYAAALELSMRKDDAEAALTATLYEEGFVSTSRRQDGDEVVITTITCESPDGCIPTGGEDLADYLAAYKVARLDLTRDEHRLRGGVSTPCRLSDYRPICLLYVESLPDLLRAYTQVYAALADPDAAGSALDTATARAEREMRELSERFAALYATTFPAIDVTKPNYVTVTEIALLRRYERAIADATAPELPPALTDPTPSAVD